MKKLIMFLMVMAIASPSLAVLEDVPPRIDTSMGVTTAVWDFATEPPYIGDPWDENNLPQCIEPDDAYTFMHPIFEGDPAWENGELNSCIWYSVEVPEGGAYVTLYIQVHMGEDSDPPVWVEVQGQDCFPAEVDQCNEYFADDPDLEIVGNVATYQVTMARDAGMVGLGGFIQGDEFDEAGDRRYTGLIVDVIVHDTPTPPAGGPRISACFEPPVFIIDPNVMTVYETGETEGDFVVSMYNPIPAGETVTVTVDPNGGNGGWGEGSDSDKDIQLIGGQGADNQITLTFDQNNWNVPQTIRFKAIDDEEPEPPDLLEAKRISISSVYSGAIQDPNWAGQKVVTVNVMDDDQANILFTYTPTEKDTPKYPVTGPVQIWEEPRWFWGSPYDRWRKIGITLQVPPLVDGDPCQPTSVKLQAAVEGDIEGDNFPLTTPTLPYEETDDPNGIIFTAANYNVTQSIKVWGNDDNLLQAIDATADGDEDYQATLVVTVIDDGGDTRYTDLEQTVILDIEDNECGAYGISYLDIGNPNALTDPNYLDEEGNPLPDCHVDIYDIIEFASRWLECSDPQDPSCESYL